MGCALCGPQYIGFANSDRIPDSFQAIHSRSDGRRLEVRKRPTARALKRKNKQQNPKQMSSLALLGAIYKIFFPNP